MNKALLNPFDSDFPELYDGVMSGTDGTSCVSFNRWGTLLAAGTSSGHVIVWDFETRGIARKLVQEVSSSAISSVSWTQNGRKLLGSLSTGTIIQWDIRSGSIDHCVTYQYPIYNSDQHPLDISLCAICFNGCPPALARLNESTATLIPVNVSPFTSKSVPKCIRFSDDGNAFFIGWSLSGVTKHDAQTLEILASASFTGNATQIHLDIGVNDTLLVTSNDRIRVCDSRSLQLRKELSDVVNRTQFYSSCLSNNGEYVAAGALFKNSPHSVYIWDVVNGSLVSLLDGTSLGIISLQWHPNTPLLLAVIKSEQIVIWSKNVNKNWSAFAPDFVELHENVYAHDADELDSVPNHCSSGTDQIIDIGTRMPFCPFDDELKYIPVSPKTV